MKGLRLASAAILMALPASAIVLAPSALAHSGHKHHRHHHAHHARHQAHTVSFEARVVHSSARKLVVRTLGGKTMSFSAGQLRTGPVAKHHRAHHGRAHGADAQGAPGQAVVNILGLQPGVLVDITETTDANGNLTITITLVSQTGPQSVTGLVTEVDTDAFMVQTGDGSQLRLHMGADALSNLNLQSCNTVDVTYHQDAGMLIADNVNITGTSTSGDCAPTQDSTGTITTVSSGSITINADQGPLTASVDPSSGLTDGFQVGDLVDVTYTQNGDGSLSATDVQYVEEETTGQVTSVTTSQSGGSVTITDDNTGQPDTFVADPSNGVEINSDAFNGVQVGDQIDVCYHVSGGQLVADTVTVNQ
ncbi:MAG: hypothetical protein ACR2L9_05960 [Solirubrobacteraceae bacterium]